MAFDTALNIIADSAVELGLVSFASKPTDAFGSTDPNVGQLCQLLKSVGRQLLREHQWTHLQSSWAFLTVANQGRYSLPADFDRVIDQTVWNRSNRLPLGGPVSPQTFSFFKARLVGVSWNLLWRVLQDKFQAYPDTTTPGAYAIAYEYVSRWWVTPAGSQATSGPWNNATVYGAGAYVSAGGNTYQTTAGGTSGTYSPAGTGNGISDGSVLWNFSQVSGADVPVANGDTIGFDPQLVRAALKLAFKREKGFDVSAAEDDYQRSLRQAIEADVVAPVLNLGQGNFSEPLLGPWNLPTNGTAGQ